MMHSLSAKTVSCRQSAPAGLILRAYYSAAQFFFALRFYFFAFTFRLTPI